MALHLTDRELMELLILGTREEISGRNSFDDRTSRRPCSLRRSLLEMRRNDPIRSDRQVIDPRLLVRDHGRDALAELVAQRVRLHFSTQPLKGSLPVVEVGDALLARASAAVENGNVDALAHACNRPYFELQGMTDSNS